MKGSGEWGVGEKMPLPTPYLSMLTTVSAAKSESGCEASFPDDSIFPKCDRSAATDRVQPVWKVSGGFRFPLDCPERFAESECSPWCSLCHIPLRYLPEPKNSLCEFGLSFRITLLSESCGSGDNNPLRFPYPVSKCRGPDKIRSSYFSPG